MDLPAAALLAPSERYIVVERIGSGSSGVIYRGLDQLTDQSIALKVQVLPSAAAAHELTAYAAVSHFRHRHVCQMLYHYVSDTSLTMIFELAYTNLQALFETTECQAGHLPVYNIGKHMVGILSGAGHLHEQGLIHSDLSLANMLIARDGRSMVTDLGSCSRSCRMLTGASLRTTVYITSPEIWLEDQVTSAIDVWAVGIATMCLMMGSFSPIVPSEISMDNVCSAMLHTLGGIDEHIWPGIQSLPRWNVFFERYPKHLRIPPCTNLPKRLMNMLPKERPNLQVGLEMVRSLLVWCPNDRPSCLHARRHSPFQSFVLVQELDINVVFDAQVTAGSWQ